MDGDIAELGGPEPGESGWTMCTGHCCGWTPGESSYMSRSRGRSEPRAGVGRKEAGGT